MRYNAVWRTSSTAKSFQNCFQHCFEYHHFLRISLVTIRIKGKKLVETQWIDDSSLEDGFASLDNYTFDLNMNTRKSKDDCAI